MTLQTLGASILTAVVRNGTGWFQKAAADGKFSDYEKRKLLETTIRVIIIEFSVYYGIGSALTQMGVDWNLISNSGLSFLIDYVVQKFKRK